MVVLGKLGLLLVSLMSARLFIVESGSMEPSIKVGSMVIVVPSAKYSPGGVITFNDADMVVTHRVESVSGQGFVTKGDANKIMDLKYVKESDVIGKVILRVPYIGYYLSKLFKT